MPHEEQASPSLSTAAFLKRVLLLIGVSVAAAFLGGRAGLDQRQQIALGVFMSAVLGTLLFWNLRLSVAFIGISILVFTRSLTIGQYVESAEVPIILFLVGMMIILGCLEDLGFFTWVVQSIISLPRMSARRFVTVVSLVAALLACVVDEVTSIIIIATLIFQVCGRLKIKPTPFIIASVIATNIGSAGTMVGNPVGILIGAKAGFTFGDFLVWAFPVMLVCQAANIGLTFFVFRHSLADFDKALTVWTSDGAAEPRVRLPFKRSLFVLCVTILCIALHHQAETVMGIERNAVLFLAPIFCAALVMLYRRDRARHYVERSVDWWTLLFFMMFFAIAGTLKHSGVTAVLAQKYTGIVSGNYNLLVGGVISASAVGSAFVDNVVFVAAFAPIIESLKTAGLAVSPLWWALLFGACFGGNITLIGSTANIVALGMLEKQARTQIRFMEWLKVGLLSAVITCALAGGAIVLLKNRMPETAPAPVHGMALQPAGEPGAQPAE